MDKLLAIILMIMVFILISLGVSSCRTPHIFQSEFGYELEQCMKACAEGSMEKFLGCHCKSEE